MRSYIPHSRPLLGAAEQEAIARVVASGQLAQGPEVAELERELSAYLGIEAVALSNGTAALHLALLQRGVGPGHNVVVPAYTCVSLLNAVSYTGARVKLIDCSTQVPEPDSRAYLAAIDEQTAAVVAPHLFGRMIDVDELRSRLPAGVALIEDATQSLGARSAAGLAGSRGEAGVFSFYATKMLAGGEAGILASSDEGMCEFGRDRRDYDFRQDWTVRYNYKMTDMSAALLRVQLRQLPAFLERRQAIADHYRRELAGLGRASLLAAQPGSVAYRFVLRSQRELDDLIAACDARGVGVRRPVFRALHHCLGLPENDFPGAQQWWRDCASIPCYPALRDEEVEKIVEVVRGELS